MLKILVVDDDHAVRSAIGARLVQADYEVALACGGAEAIDKFNADQPDLILLDASMPDVSGFDVCRYVRGADPGRHTRVVFLTGASTPSPDYVERCAETSEADAIVRKPYDPGDLVNLVQSLLAPTELEEVHL